MFGKKFFSKASILFLLCLSLLFGIIDRAWAGSWTNPGVWPPSNSYNILCMAASPDGKIWAAGQSGKVSYHNGSSWVNPGSWPGGTSYIYTITVGNDGTAWFGGIGGKTASWNGSWQDRGTISSGKDIRASATGKDGTIYVADNSGNVYKWNGSTWVSLGQWPAGSTLIYSMTVGLDGSIWVGGANANVAVWDGSSWTSKSWTNGTTIYSMTTAYDGSIWVGGSSGKTGRYNGTSWEDKGYWPVGSSYSISGMCSAPDGAIWAVGANFSTARWNGTSWVDMGHPVEMYGASYIFWGVTVRTDGTIWAGGYGGVVRSYNSALSTFSFTGASQNSVSFSFGYDDGGLIGAKIQRSTDNINFTDVLTVSGASAVDTSASPGTTYYYRLMWGVLGKQIGYTSSVSALTIPATPGAPSVTASSSTSMNISWSTITGAQTYQVYRNGTKIYDGSGTSCSDSGLSVNTQYTYTMTAWNSSGMTPTGSVTAKYTLANAPTATAYSGFSQTGLTANINANGNPAGTQYQFQLKNAGGSVIQGPTVWGTATSYNFTGLSSGINYSVEAKARNRNNVETGWVNLGTTITIPGNPTLTGSYRGLSWSNTAGRGYVTGYWSAITGALGYKLRVFDGYDYRVFDLGNVISFDTRVLKIYPAESTLDGYSNNTVTSDIFNHVQGGNDLRDTPIKLYQKTSGTTYDSNNNYWFRLTAYNSSGESDILASSALYQPTLPNRTDTSVPTSSTFIINGGAANAGSREVTVSITASDPVVSNYTGDTSDDYSGLSKIQISNDNFTSYQEFNWPTQGQQSGAATFSWTLVAGDGSKTVYNRPVDQASNVGPVRTASIYLVNDITPPAVSITLNGASSNVTTDSRYNLLGITANDNLTPPDQLQYRAKVGSSSFSSWSTYTPTISDFDIGTTGGSLGITVEVKDANGNVGSATLLIYYNTEDTRPAAANTSPTSTATTGINLDGQVVSVGGTNMTVLQGDTVTLPVSGISNANQLLVSFDGVNWSSPDMIPSGSTSMNKTVTFSGEGTKALYYKTRNNYGAESPVYVKYFLVDKTAPDIIEVKTASGAWATSGSAIQLVISAKDNISRQLSYRINGSAWATLPTDGVVTATLSSNGINALKIEVVDQAGNVSSRVIPVRKIATLDTYAVEYQNAA